MHACTLKTGGAMMALLMAAGSALGAVTPAGVGLMGDSLSDEYRFPLYQPGPAGTDRSHAQSYPEILATVHGATPALNFGTYTTVSRGAPRNAGFEFDWAQDGDTSSDMLNDGQPAGLAQQVAHGQVDVVGVLVGSNDFKAGFFDPSKLATIPATVLGNVASAVNTILAADPNVKVIVGNQVDISYIPLAAAAPQILKDAMRGAIQGYNGALAAQFAGNPRVTIMDAFGVLEGVMAPASYSFEGHEINRTVPGDGPWDFFADGMHPGTFGQALLANAFLDAMDQGLKYQAPLLSNAEIEQIVPEPGALGLLGLALPLLASRRRAG